jgi:phosphopantothenoylcysteine decarboxylase/phosphopantothenate--cysteine ligase
MSARLLNKRILLIVGGGIAAYKTPELVRQLVKEGADVQCLLSKSGSEFVTALTLASVSGNKVYQNLFDLTDETEMGHIQLSRNADLVLVAPATADLMAKNGARVCQRPRQHGLTGNRQASDDCASHECAYVAS